MIVDVDVRCHFFGDEFSAKKVEEFTGLNLENKWEAGEIANRGMYKGVPIPYGNGELSPPSKFKENDDFGLEWITVTMYKHIDQIRSCGAENIDLVTGEFSSIKNIKGRS